jgi:hypothetical protein
MQSKTLIIELIYRPRYDAEIVFYDYGHRYCFVGLAPQNRPEKILYTNLCGMHRYYTMSLKIRGFRYARK